MRFMMFMIPPEYQSNASADQKAKANFTPPKEAVEAMAKYNEELAKAGVLVSLEGLHPLVSGARITFRGGKQLVTEGPFVEAKEVVGGFWMIKVKSKDEAVDWAKRCPAVKAESGAVIEVRQVFELSEFPSEVREAANETAIADAMKKSR